MIKFREYSPNGNNVINYADSDSDSDEDVGVDPTAYLFINGHSCVYRNKLVNAPTGKRIIKKTQAPYGCSNSVTSTRNEIEVYNNLITDLEYLTTSFEDAGNLGDVSIHSRTYRDNPNLKAPREPTMCYENPQYTINRLDWELVKEDESKKLPMTDVRVCNLTVNAKKYHQREYSLYENDNIKNGPDKYNGVFLGLKNQNTNAWTIYNLLRKNQYFLHNSNLIYGLEELVSHYSYQLIYWDRRKRKIDYHKDSIGFYNLEITTKFIFNILQLLPFTKYKILDLGCVENCRGYEKIELMTKFNYNDETIAYGKRYTNKNKKHFKKNMKRSRVK